LLVRRRYSRSHLRGPCSAAGCRSERFARGVDTRAVPGGLAALAWGGRREFSTSERTSACLLRVRCQTNIAQSCFEPDPDSAKLCRFSLAQMPQSTVVQTAVGATARQRTVSIDSGSSRRTLVQEPAGAHNTKAAATGVISLSTWLDRYGSVDLLKLDGDRSEWESHESVPGSFRR
jgi:hypothetical protein